MKNNIRTGIKISTRNFNLLPFIYSNRDIIDYIEIILMPEFSFDDIKTIQNLKMKYAIHVPNSNYGIDFGNIDKNDKNLEYIDKINSYWDKLEPFCYIIHPESGDLELSITNIKKLKVKPIAIENMPLKSPFGGNLLGYDPNSLLKYFEKIPDLKFCFDLGHAIKTAISKKIDYLDFIKDFLLFKRPIIFHISGGNLDNEFDDHLHLDEGQFDISEIRKILLDYGFKVYLSFETPRNYEKKIDDDLKNIKTFLKS